MNRVVAPEIVSPMPKKHIRQGTVLVLRVTAVTAGEMSGNKEYRGKESECNHGHES